MGMEVLRNKPRQDVIDALRSLLKEAEAGELRGLSILANGRSMAHTLNVGEWSASDALYAFECWKHRMLHVQQSGL